MVSIEDIQNAIEQRVRSTLFKIEIFSIFRCLSTDTKLTNQIDTV